ncbi:MAG: hypothetical protein EOO52_13220 [Gammaproteobacteria bacterium]|nr:MAG: hypothetical protein EOO52_13220 [Gammaproteobacteria bacterium]
MKTKVNTYAVSVAVKVLSCVQLKITSIGREDATQLLLGIKISPEQFRQLEVESTNLQCRLATEPQLRNRVSLRSEKTLEQYGYSYRGAI